MNIGQRSYIQLMHKARQGLPLHKARQGLPLLVHQQLKIKKICMSIGYHYL